jgi:hypothetical protein
VHISTQKGGAYKQACTLPATPFVNPFLNEPFVNRLYTQVGQVVDALLMVMFRMTNS